ncbi:MAG: acyl-ACP thioesterase domain-containing protein [Ilumatobacteraceae bacterium]
MSERPATALLAANPGGRTFRTERTVRLGDVDAHGRLRLDAIARHLQDVASDDALDADLPNAMGWVVRRTMIRIEQPGVLNERIALTTFCTGAGRSWAERRTSISGAEGAAIEAVSLWVQIDVDTGRPARLGPAFFDRYGTAAAERVVSSKLSLPAPPAGSRGTPWSFRRSDLDPFEHVNNAAHWVVAEEWLAGRDRCGTAELEYLAPVGLEPVEFVHDADQAWLVQDGRTVTALAWTGN